MMELSSRVAKTEITQLMHQGNKHICRRRNHTAQSETKQLTLEEINSQLKYC